MQSSIQIGNHLRVSSSFLEFLKVKCRVNSMIFSLETLEGINYLMPTDKPDTVSYLPQKRVQSAIDNGIDPFNDAAGRVSIKIGRLVQKLFDKSVLDVYLEDTDIEEFVNLYKSFFNQSDKRILVVIGEEIRKWYLETNYGYPEKGTLWKSCMRYAEKQKFLDLYVNNPDKIKMVVMLENFDGYEKVVARALLWESVGLPHPKKGVPETLKVMDRIYYIHDSNAYMLKKWAVENGYIYKAYQNAQSQNVFIVDDQEVNLNLGLSLKNHRFKYYPYLDTFQFYSSNGYFSCSGIYNYDYQLVQTDGSLEPQPENDEQMYEEDFL